MNKVTTQAARYCIVNHTTHATRFINDTTNLALEATTELVNAVNAQDKKLDEFIKIQIETIATFHKLLINNVLSQSGTRFATFDIKNFYLNTPLERFEWAWVQLDDISKSLYKNTTSRTLCIMVGSTLRYARASTAFSRWAN